MCEFSTALLSFDLPIVAAWLDIFRAHPFPGPELVRRPGIPGLLQSYSCGGRHVERQSRCIFCNLDHPKFLSTVPAVTAQDLSFSRTPMHSAGPVLKDQCPWRLPYPVLALC